MRRSYAIALWKPDFAPDATYALRRRHTRCAAQTPQRPFVTMHPGRRTLHWTMITRYGGLPEAVLALSLSDPGPVNFGARIERHRFRILTLYNEAAETIP